MANFGSRGLRAIYPGCHSWIRIDAIWLATELMDILLLSRVLHLRMPDERANQARGQHHQPA